VAGPALQVHAVQVLWDGEGDAVNVER
jgi:hypothetical protein